MRLATVWHGDGPVVALVHGEHVLGLRAAVAATVSSVEAERLPRTMLDLLHAGPAALDTVRRCAAALTGEASPPARLGSASESRFLPPVRPGKIVCLAGNYAEHIDEGGKERAPQKETTNPWLFSKPVSTGLVGQDDAVVIPRVTSTIDWEVELAIVIGRRAKYVSAGHADEYIFGYTVFNDISARTLNLAPGRTERPKDPFYDWLHGKQMDTHACLGPWIVDREEVGDAQDLDLRLAVNGVVKQDSNTARMIFFLPEIVEFASQIMTLEAGDVIATGSPAGIGHVRGEYLHPGDRVEATIERIGTLRNHMVAERDEVEP